MDCHPWLDINLIQTRFQQFRYLKTHLYFYYDEDKYKIISQGAVKNKKGYKVMKKILKSMLKSAKKE